MKIVCACLNSKYIHSSLAPWCLRAGIKAFCSAECEVKVIEATINSDISQFASAIINESPDIVALSCYIWNIESTLQACRLIKSSIPTCKIALGGPEVCYRAEEVIADNDEVDFILTGEGEWSFSALINTLQNNGDFSLSEGLTYRINGQIFSNSEKFHCETPPSPYCEEYFGRINGRIAYIESSRGCPFRCSYCLSGRVSPLRYFDVDETLNNILRLSQSGTKTIKFVDRTFNADAHYANAVFSFIRDNYGGAISDKVCFHFEITADFLKESTLRILKEMPFGACQLEIGIQSFNNDTLKGINRHVNMQSLICNIKRLIEFGNIHVHTDLIAGLPYETAESFSAGFDQAFSLRSHMLQLGFLKILSGTELYEQTSTFGCTYSDSPPYEFSFNKWIGAGDKKILKNCEAALDKLYNSGRFHYTIDYLLNTMKLTPFSFFSETGSFIINNMTLSELAGMLYEKYCDKCDKTVLREKICCDIISTSANITIPDSLIVIEPLYKRNKKYYSELFKENIKIVILHSCNKVYIVKQSDKKNLYGRFDGIFLELIK